MHMHVHVSLFIAITIHICTTHMAMWYFKKCYELNSFTFGIQWFECLKNMKCILNYSYTCVCMSAVEEPLERPDYWRVSPFKRFTPLGGLALSEVCLVGGLKLSRFSPSPESRPLKGLALSGVLPSQGSRSQGSRPLKGLVLSEFSPSQGLAISNSRLSEVSPSHWILSETLVETWTLNSEHWSQNSMY